jgi:hypothetical protein
MNLGIEDEFTEFKASLAQLDKGLKSVTAMLNKHGEANVYFGVVTAKLVCHQNSPLNCQILSSKIFLSKRS